MRKPEPLDKDRKKAKDVKLFAKTITEPGKVGFRATFMFGPFDKPEDKEEDDKKG